MARQETDFLDTAFEFSELDIPGYQYFNQLLHHRTVVLNDEITEDFMERVYLPLRDFENDDSNEPITLIVSTPGGSIADSLFICDYLKRYKKKLDIIVCGCACSMGTVICAGVSSNPNITRYAYENTFFLVHDGYTALAGQTESKTAEDLMKFNAQVDKRVGDIILAGTKITQKEYKSKSRKQWFLFADEAKEKGLIDKIIGVDD